MTTLSPAPRPSVPRPVVGTCDVGLVGLAVMGQNLVLNLADHGYQVGVYNRTTSVTDEFIKSNPPSVFGSLGGGLVGSHELKDFVASLKRPRIIIILVKAGPAVDAVCEQLLQAGVEPNDIVVDGGNSLWTDTIARESKYRGKLTFFGSGVSGGETGARFGPSLMPGGDPKAWQRL
ncbi:MAG TPA: NAD(P)-binding domain-containing protein, partial [Phycisphaerales bacterium]|nr:NAD(P)-binding domain-containing protein [Phycisphaerales bacterium]